MSDWVSGIFESVLTVTIEVSDRSTLSTNSFQESK